MSQYPYGKSPETTRVFLLCERCKKATRHEFSHYETLETIGLNNRTRDLHYRCDCGKNRRWGREQEG